MLHRLSRTGKLSIDLSAPPFVLRLSKDERSVFSRINITVGPLDASLKAAGAIVKALEIDAKAD